MGVNNPNFGKARSKEIREKISEALMGRKISEETKAKIRKANLGDNNPNFGKLGADHHNFGKALAEERKLNLSSIRGTAVEVYDTETKVKSFYSSGRKAGEALTCSKTTISKYIESQELFRGKYRITKASNNDVKEGGGELPLKKTLSAGSDSGFGVLRGAQLQLREGFNHPKGSGRRKYHSSSNNYPIFLQRINGNKNIGRVLGKYVSTKTKAAGNASIMKFNGQSKVDKLYEYCKKIQQQQQSNRTNVIIKRKVYNLLYEQIIYKLAYEMLINKSYNMVILTVKDKQYLNLNIFGCLILHPNLLGFNFETIISEIIIQIKTEHYKFTDLRKNLAPPLPPCISSPEGEIYSRGGRGKGEISTTFFVATLTKDIIVIKAIVIILETIYEPSFSSRKYRSSFNHKSALKDVKMRLKGAT